MLNGWVIINKSKQNKKWKHNWEGIQ